MAKSHFERLTEETTAAKYKTIILRFFSTPDGAGPIMAST